jgi:type I restriction enzyme S subunit
VNDKQSDARELPLGWEYLRLADIALVNPARDATPSEETAEVNFVPMRAVAPEGGGLVDPEIKLYREVKKGYTSFRAGDVITAKITVPKKELTHAGYRVFCYSESPGEKHNVR